MPSHQIPNPTKLVFLIGMPGVGKTYWGEKLASQYRLDFIDLDAYISSKENQSIPALFEKYGEPGFRKLETEHLHTIITSVKNCTIVACGGGTPCFNNNMETMKTTGIVTYLEGDIPVLLENLKQDGTERPLLKGNGIEGILAGLQAGRTPFYRQAHYILPAKSISLSTFEKIIAPCINRQ
jgi:shikimate kinase